MSHVHRSHVTRTNESYHTYLRVMAHISTRPMYDWVMSHNENESRDTCIGVMSRVSTSHAAHINQAWHTYQCVMSHVWSSHVTQYTRVMSHIHRSHVTRMNESCHTYQQVMPHIWTRHVSHMHESCHILSSYGVASCSRLLKIIGLFCKRAF